MLRQRISLRLISGKYYPIAGHFLQLDLYCSLYLTSSDFLFTILFSNPEAIPYPILEIVALHYSEFYGTFKNSITFLFTNAACTIVRS